MKRDSASERQVQAADPAQSTWLSANAGSGKTRVLIDRVARLLLAGTDPQRILCLTYTKAAASEMQNRLFRRLGAWAMMPEPGLRAELAALGVAGRIDAAQLAQARRLFARAVDVPGGLKIQTIHSFCAALLRRFPLEARVSPDFTELDDRAAALMRQEIIEDLASGPDRDVIDAVAATSSAEDLSSLVQEICRNSDAFWPPFDRAAVMAAFDLPADLLPEGLAANVVTPADLALLAALVPLLLASSAQDQTAGTRLAVLSSRSPDRATLRTLESVLLYGKGAKKNAPFSAKTGAFPTKGLASGAARPLMAGVEDLMTRIEEARPRRLAIEAAEKTLVLHRFAAAFLPRYQARKAARGWLDFDDLISRAAALLADRSVAAWVLFRLDGGIDHVLVDEAQDTSPGQWRVIERLTAEFTAGEGARDQRRTIFVVGDKKQSIYSFQGADLRAFDKMRDHFGRHFAAARADMLLMELEHSFRSAEAILRVVDLTFDERVDRGLGGPTRHYAFNLAMPGRVDLWAPVPKTEKAEPGSWYDPIDILSQDHETVVLAKKIAAEIRRMVNSGTQIADADGPRPVHEGDFLILVQRRSALFHEIIRACKAARLEIAGADRLKLGGELAVKDLAALLRFLALAEDDLSLAAALRSPLFGWTEAELFDLAARRPERSFLWQALRGQTDHAATLAILDDLRGQSDFLRPYDLIERMLTRHDGRRRLLARLGPEAEDGIDALLAQALAYEQSEIPSLTGFLAWMETDDVEVKRRLDTASKAIRVMTVHGAKGLEAPIVILPDTAQRRENLRDEISLLPNGMPIWRTAVDDSPPPLTALRETLAEGQREERMRLLYVAMTRARCWLILCSVGEAAEDADGWYGLVDAAMTKAGAASRPAEGAAFEFGPGRRFEIGAWPADRPTGLAPAPTVVPAPDWAARPAPAVTTTAAPLSPSGLGGAKAFAGAEGQNQAAAMLHGTRLHLLLEHLPHHPAASWPALAETLALSVDEPGNPPPDVAALLAEASRVLASGLFATLAGAETFHEVELSACLSELGGRLVQGTIDLLAIWPDRVLAIDYKSNAVVPATADQTPDGILRQMGAYAAMLGQIYPDRRIDTAIVWTRTGGFMPLPCDIVRAALQSPTIP